MTDTSLSKLLWNSLYNYQIHEREKNIALESRRQLISWLVVTIFIVLIIAIVFLSHRIKTRHTIIRLHDTISKLEAIQQKKENPAQPISVLPSSRESLRERLKQKINQLDSATSTEPLPSDFVDSDSFKTLLKYVGEKKYIADSDPLWGELYELILQNYPLFETNLHLLIGDNIKPHELQTIILIKCGITPTQMTFLLGKAKGSISSRRVSLSTRILGEKTNQKFVDILIRSL